MFKQVYEPAINTQAQPAMCLQYIDDAGNAPNRSATAKAAFMKEHNAGRIRGDELPDKLWVVIWFEFTKGGYTYPSGATVLYKDAWHIAFARRDGNTLQIHDSEVHSGARNPYNALAAVEAWFGKYGTKYAGWSTNCDGRQYVNKEEEDMKADNYTIQALAEAGLGRTAAGDQNLINNVGRDVKEVIDTFRTYPEWKERQRKADDYDRLAAELAQLKEKPQKAPMETSEAEKKLEAIKDVLGIKDK